MILPKSKARRTRLALVPLEDRTVPATAFALTAAGLVSFDTANPAAANPAVAVTGITAGETLTGIDIRPQNAVLYGFGVNATTDTGTLYAISPRTGVATPVGTAGQVSFVTAAAVAVDLPDPATVPYELDFNPAVDRLRVVAGTLNFRVNPNTGAAIDGDLGGAAGTVAGRNTDGNINGPGTPIAGIAYTNNQPNNGNITTLYTISVTTQALYIQNPPNAGTQTTPIAVAIPGGFTAVGGFDIVAGVNAAANNAAVAAGSGFAALTVGGVTGLYAINLTTGAATAVGAIGNGTTAVRGFAVFNELGGYPSVSLDAAGTNLIRYNTATPNTSTTPVLVTGLAGAEVLVGIDYRPATGQLYGLGVDAGGANGATLYLIDPQTGAATVVGTAGQIAFVTAAAAPVPLPAPSAGYGFDFNPTVDRIRVTTATGLNFRVNPITGAPVDGDLGGPAGTVTGINTDGPINGLPGGSTGVVGAAYTNSFGGATVTTLYTLDPTSNSLFIQNPANAGTQVLQFPLTVGGAALDFSAVTGFDIPAGIRTAASGTGVTGIGVATLVVGGNIGVYYIDLNDGNAVLIGAPVVPLSALAIGDAPAGTFAFTVANPPAVGEAVGNVVLTVTRTAGNTGAVTLNLSVTGGTATPGTDFGPVPAIVSFADGQDSATVTIPVIDDTLNEPSETFTVALSGPTNLGVLGAVAATTVSITDNDPVAVAAGPVVVGGTTNGQIQLLTAAANGQLGTPTNLTVFPNSTANVRATSADVNGDGVPDLIAVTGPGVPIRVTVLSGVDNSVLVAAFDPFGGSFTGGGFVAGGDINNDGRAEFVVTPDQGGGPRVSIFNVAVGATTATSVANFFAFVDPNFFGGCRPALGDVNADGTLDLVVCAGFTGGPRTVLFNGTSLLGTPTRLINDFFAFPGTDAVNLRNGAFVAASDINGDGFDDLVFGGGPGGAPRVFILSGQTVTTAGPDAAQAAPIANFFVAGNQTDRGGVRVGFADLDGDTRGDLVVGSGEATSTAPAPPAKIRAYRGINFTTTGEPATFQDVTVFGGAVLPGGVFVG